MSGADEKVFVGRRVIVPQGMGTRQEGIYVEVNGQPLKTYHRIWRHSEGFEWGYQGSGPAQLAVALVMEVYGDEELVKIVHQEVKRQLVAKLPERWWMIHESQVREIVDKIVAKGREL